MFDDPASFAQENLELPPPPLLQRSIGCLQCSHAQKYELLQSRHRDIIFHYCQQPIFLQLRWYFCMHSAVRNLCPASNYWCLSSSSSFLVSSRLLLLLVRLFSASCLPWLAGNSASRGSPGIKNANQWVDVEIRDAARVATGHAHTAARHDIFHAPLLNHLLSHWTTASVFSTYSFAAYRFAALLTTLPPSPAQLLLLTATFFLSPLTYQVCVRGKKKLTYPRRVFPPPPKTTKEISLFWVGNFWTFSVTNSMIFFFKKKSPKSLNITRFLYTIQSTPCTQNYIVIFPVFPFIFF